MIGKRRTAEILKAIDGLPKGARRHQVTRVFLLALLNLKRDTGEITLTREEMAADLGCTARAISSAMTALAEIGAVRRTRQPVRGLPGPGRVVYFIDPDAAWNGSLARRKAAASREPRLRVVSTSD